MVPACVVLQTYTIYSDFVWGYKMFKNVGRSVFNPCWRWLRWRCSPMTVVILYGLFWSPLTITIYQTFMISPLILTILLATLTTLSLILQLYPNYKKRDLSLFFALIHHSKRVIFPLLFVSIALLSLRFEQRILYSYETTNCFPPSLLSLTMLWKHW